MDTLIQGFSAKVHIGPLSVYSPTTERLTLEARAREIDPEKHIAARKKEWQERYERSCEILDRHLRLHHGIGYKAITRADIELVVNK